MSTEYTNKIRKDALDIQHKQSYQYTLTNKWQDLLDIQYLSSLWYLAWLSALDTTDLLWKLSNSVLNIDTDGINLNACLVSAVLSEVSSFEKSVREAEKKLGHYEISRLLMVNGRAIKEKITLKKTFWRQVQIDILEGGLIAELLVEGPFLRLP